MAQGDRGFQVFALDNPQAARTIKAKLEKLNEEKIEQLTVAQDWSDYKRRVGVIEGLNEALRVCDELEQAERA